MKKFKLIKWYPSITDNGTVGSLATKSPKDSVYKMKNLWIPREDVENNPEFWQEIIEKDYKILSVSIRRSERHTVRMVDSFDSDDYITLLINCDGNSINSVQRLSDNKVFTVGEIVFRNKSWEVVSPCYIKAFTPLNNSLKVSIRQNDIIGNYPFDNEMYKTKTALFITEDGVDIFEGDTYYASYKVEYKSLQVRGPFINGEYTSEKCVQFSTKEAAEEYILMNKPCLSINDITYNLGRAHVNGEMMESLKKLVKRKWEYQ